MLFKARSFRLRVTELQPPTPGLQGSLIQLWSLPARSYSLLASMSLGRMENWCKVTELQLTLRGKGICTILFFSKCMFYKRPFKITNQRSRRLQKELLVPLFCPESFFSTQRKSQLDVRRCGEQKAGVFSQGNCSHQIQKFLPFYVISRKQHLSAAQHLQDQGFYKFLKSFHL